ncbi:MAG TPA: nucleotide sugar dehydrogenase [Nitrospiraceae bacterium]
MAKSGHEVTGIDVNETKINLIKQGKSPIIEPRLQDLLKEGIDSGRLKATSGEFPDADVSIVCVGTPSKDNGSLELGYIERVVRQIGEYLKNRDAYHVVNIRSTVLPGTIENVLLPILEEASGKKEGKDFGLCMNPEFMREGTSVEDYYHPPFTVIGQRDGKSGDTVARLYDGVDAPVRRTTIRAAEMIKYACNAFHALKVAFSNEIGNICKKVDVDSHEVMDIFCMDKKLNISSYYMKPGFAFGGSCLPKDVRALTYKARTVDLELPVLNAILASNSNQVDVAYRMIAGTGKKKIGMFGLSFKTFSDDLRESPMVDLAEKLIGKGYEVMIYDHEVSLSRIFGANKQYIDQVIPHVSSLIVEKPDELANKAEVVVIAKKSKASEEALKHIGNGTTVIDLVRVSDDITRKGDRYEGICW